MTTSSNHPIDDAHRPDPSAADADGPNVTEGEPFERPEQESSGSKVGKILVLITLIAIGVAGVYVAVILFSALLEESVDTRDSQVQPLQQAPAEPTDRPRQNQVPPNQPSSSDSPASNSPTSK